MQNQLPKLASPLRCLWACYSMWTPQNTSLMYKLIAGN